MPEDVNGQSMGLRRKRKADGSIQEEEEGRMTFKRSLKKVNPALSKYWYPNKIKEIKDGGSILENLFDGEFVASPKKQPEQIEKT